MSKTMKFYIHKIMRKHAFLLGGVLILTLVSACAMLASRKVSHAGFSVIVPHDWGDYTQDKTNCLSVARIWGTTGLTIEKLPGQSESNLALYRKVWVQPPNHGTEEPITEWYGFKGKGFKFKDSIGREAVIFYPEGECSGWYLDAVFTGNETGSLASLEAAVSSLKLEPNSN